MVGGGDTSMEEVIFLTRFASRVHLIHRRSEFRASKIMLDRARVHEKIQFIAPAVVEEVHDVGKSSVEVLQLRNPETGAHSTLAVEGLFGSYRPRPQYQAFRGQLDMDENGYLDHA